MNGDPSALHARLAFEAFAALGLDVPSASPVAVWVGDDYAGLYLILETYDANYFASRDHDPIQLYQAESGKADFTDDHRLSTAFSEKLGSCGRSDLQALQNALADDSSANSLAQLKGLVDVEQLQTYLSASALLDNRDGIDNNYYLVRTQEEPRFRVLPWDLDLTFGEPHPDHDAALFSSNALFAGLVDGTEDNQAYRDVYARTRKQLTGAQLSNRARAMVEEIRAAYEADWFLSAGEQSLDEHLATLESHLAEVEGTNAFGR
jgi:spore coat protein CotH